MINVAMLPKPAASSRGIINLLNRTQRTFELPAFPDLTEAPEQHTMFLSLRPIDRPSQQYHSAHMTCDLGEATVFATREWLEQLCDIFLSGWRDETREALSWDVCIAYVLSRLSKLSGFHAGPMNFRDVKVDVEIPDSPQDSVLHANVRSGDQAFPLAVQLHNCDLNKASLLLGREITTGGELECGVAELVDPGFVYKMTCRPQMFDVQMLRQVKTGSIITFDRIIDGGCHVVCTVQDIVCFDAVFHPHSQLTVKKIVKKEGPLMASDITQSNMEQERDIEGTAALDGAAPQDVGPLDLADEQLAGSAADADNQDIPALEQRIDEMSRAQDIEHLPVSVEFCFPSQRMSLGELSALGLGSSFKLSCALEDRLTVRVNGRQVGGGYLVDLDGVLGLKVSDWALSTVGDRAQAGNELD